MFSGIVEEVGRLRSNTDGDLIIEADIVLEGTSLGDSISVNGACLTVTTLSENYFLVHTVPETLRLTNLGDLQPGSPVNLERALALTDRLDGHIVQGHIEGVAELLSITPDGPDSVRLTYRVAEPLLPYIVTKGFIAVNGVSLTVVDVDDDHFSVAIIPYTQEHTNLTSMAVGGRVNIETDIVARYLERFILMGHLPVDG